MRKTRILSFFRSLYLVIKKPSTILSKIKRLKRKRQTHIFDFQDVGLFLINQFKNSKFNRYDIVARYLVLKNNFESDYFNNKYIEMQNKRLPNNKLRGESRLQIFQDLYQDIKKYYKYDEGAILLNQDNHLIDGSHRVAINLFLNNDSIPVIKNNQIETNYNLDWFYEHSFEDEYINELEEHKNNLLLQKGAIFFVFIWSDADHSRDLIKNTIMKNGFKVKLEIIDINVSNLNNFVKSIYLSYSFEDSEIEHKLNLLKQSNENKFTVYGIQIDNPNLRIKKNAISVISSNIENLKISLRDIYEKNITLDAQKKHVIIYISDNFVKNRYIYRLLKEYKIVT